MNPLSFLLLLGAALIGFLASNLGRVLWRERFPYTAHPALLTPAEQKFYDALAPLIPSDLALHLKVRLADIITCSDADWPTHGGKIAGKHVDFVVIDRTSFRVVLAIELDDASHKRPDRMARDVFVDGALKAAKIPLWRVGAQAKYDREALREALQSYVPPVEAHPAKFFVDRTQ